MNLITETKTDLYYQLWVTLSVGTCEASRFDSNWTIPIRNMFMILCLCSKSIHTR